MPAMTLEDSLQSYLKTVELSRSPRTHRTYAQACDRFRGMLAKRGLKAEGLEAAALSVEWLGWFVAYLKEYAVATERLYLAALAGYYDFTAAEEHAAVNLPAMRQIIRRRQRKAPARLIRFPREQIELTLDYIDTIAAGPVEDERQRLIHLRDRALIYTLADTGLRVSEACGLTRGHVDWDEGRAVVIGKGGGEAVVRFSGRALARLKQYLAARAARDGASGRPLPSLALFARHDDGAGERVLRIGAGTARKIVEEVVVGALGAEYRGQITPHSYRHYFVTVVLRASGGNLRLAQELARHKNIAITERYAHLSDDDLDRGYHEIFNQ